MNSFIKKNEMMILHVNPIGLIRVAKKNINRFDEFNSWLNDVKNKGGNIALPVFIFIY